jgi:IS30 family transposase
MADDMADKRVTEEERRHIYRWRQAGYGVREVARPLVRKEVEVKRNGLRWVV